LNPSPYPGDSGAISAHEKESNQRRLKNQTLVFALGALGVVYGDIGTSPLYAIRECFHRHHAITLTPGNTYYLARVSLFTTGDSKMMRWRKVLFAFMSRNTGTPATYFGLPANRVVELGSQVDL
jgi:K+ transporter